MARYDYKCQRCDFIKEVSHGMSESPTILCDLCNEVMSKMIPKSLNFVLKGTGWAGKNIKEKSHRERRSREIGKKMASTYDILQISPNYKGEVCNSWNEAKKLAVKDGTDPLSYDKQIQTLKAEEKRVETKRDKLLKGEG